jgi:hypothetical protein
MKNILLSLLTLLLAACTASDGHIETLPGPSPEVTPAPVSSPHSTLYVKFGLLNNIPPNILVKLHETADLLNKMFAGQRFKYEVLNHRYEGQKSYAQNGGLSNQQIYDVIMSGKETIGGVPDGRMDLHLESYYEDSITIGYTYPWTNKIYVNRKFYDHYSPEDIAGNLMHEWLHKLGFQHDSKRTERRPFTVPYAIGNLTEKIVRSPLTLNANSENVK